MTLERLDMCEGIIADQKMVFLINKLYENQIKLDVTRFLGQTEEKVRKARLGKVAENGEGIREIVLRMKNAFKTVLIPVFIQASRRSANASGVGGGGGLAAAAAAITTRN